MYVIPFLSVNVQSCIFSYQTCFIEERGWFKRASGVMKINDSGIVLRTRSGMVRDRPPLVWMPAATDVLTVRNQASFQVAHGRNSDML